MPAGEMLEPSTAETKLRPNNAAFSGTSVPGISSSDPDAAGLHESDPGVPGSAGLTVGIDDLKGFFQPKRFNGPFEVEDRGACSSQGRGGVGKRCLTAARPAAEGRAAGAARPSPSMNGTEGRERKTKGFFTLRSISSSLPLLPAAGEGEGRAAAAPERRDSPSPKPTAGQGAEDESGSSPAARVEGHESAARPRAASHHPRSTAPRTGNSALPPRQSRAATQRGKLRQSPCRHHSTRSSPPQDLLGAPPRRKRGYLAGGGVRPHRRRAS